MQARGVESAQDVAAVEGLPQDPAEVSRGAIVVVQQTAVAGAGALALVVEVLVRSCMQDELLQGMRAAAPEGAQETAKRQVRSSAHRRSSRSTVEVEKHTLVEE